eukprot:TRINITY_DN2339_c0_g2_i1.p1 TRINITY_DN2339_c0_g2~~TRINITY_DN2339_c0_g2_i1.p1  ORF type:complete len:353 (+),score=130.99 TRINITY_DN2339_c0_g2_i1:669-1727(+)
MLAHLLCTLGVSASVGVSSGNVTYAMSRMQVYYNRIDGEWGTTSWWHSGNVLEAMCNGMLYTGDKEYEDIVAHTWSATALEYDMHRLTAGYDDISWWGLGWVRSTVLTGDKKYLERAKGYYDQVHATWNSTCGGGVYWDRAKTYKNSITNELYITLGTQLYLQTNDTTYLDNAMRGWEWFYSTPMWGASDSALIIDGLTSTCGGTGAVWTYNQGVVLGGLSDLYLITKNVSYIEHAYGKAVATAEKMTTNGILQEPSLGQGAISDAEQFKGIFARYVGYLLRRTTPPPAALQQSYDTLKAFLNTNANSVLYKDIDGQGHYGFYWEGPPTKPAKPNYITHCSGMDVVTAAFGL